MTQPDLFDAPAIPPDISARLSQEERDVLLVLLRHTGKDAAMSGARLADEAGIAARDSKRMVRRIVGSLRRTHGVAVCSNAHRGNSGYYLADSADELDEAAGWLIRLGLKILSSAARMKRKTMAEFMGQLRFEDWQKDEERPSVNQPIIAEKLNNSA